MRELTFARSFLKSITAASVLVERVLAVKFIE